MSERIENTTIDLLNSMRNHVNALADENVIDPVRVRYAIKDRKKLAAQLHTRGLDNCAIAEVLGVSNQTISRDLSNSPNGECSDEAGETFFSEVEPDHELSDEEQRLQEIQELNDETRQAKLYASLFYMPAREIANMLDDGEKAEHVVQIMRRRRYVLKVDVTPMELKKAGEMFLRLAKQETR